MPTGKRVSDEACEVVLSKTDYLVQPCSRKLAKQMVAKYHYACKCPPHVLETFGLHDQGKLVGVALFGWGVRPRHSIQKLFPSLNTENYRELNRLCVLDSVPRNGESFLLAKCAKYFQKQAGISVLTSWADGMRNKPGFVYQASNWLFAGFIETEFYVDDKGRVAHPRALITNFGSRTKETTEGLGLKKIRGKQFLYIRFVCSHKEEKRLRAECTVPLTMEYPKLDDCLVWNAGDVSREIRQATSLEGVVQFRTPALDLFAVAEVNKAMDNKGE